MRKLFGLFKEAVRATLAAKSRTILSAICIGLGIAGVTLVTALGAAAVSKTHEIMDLFGSDSVYLMSGGRKKMATGRRNYTLTVDDVAGLRQNFPDAYLVTPLRTVFNMLVSYKNAKLTSELEAINTSAADEWNWKIGQGRDFTKEDNEYSANVCVIGDYVRETLFTDEDPLGKYINIGRSICEVIGVAERKSMGAFDDEMNTFVMIPESIFLKKFTWRKTMLMGIRMRFYDPATIDKQMKSVEEYLRHKHNIPDGAENDFQFLTPSAIASMMFAVLGAIGAFLATITLVVVVVGGFVTANIFLLSTQSRIKEIGIRRAFGATGQDIFIQFIMEFLLIAFCGMLVGLLIGSAAAAFISSFGFLEVKITAVVFLITAAVSLAIAVIFGILPARSASRISPIDAIRSL